MMVAVVAVILLSSLLPLLSHGHCQAEGEVRSEIGEPEPGGEREREGCDGRRGG